MDKNIEFDLIHCCVCGFIFAVPRQWKNKREEDGVDFSCVSCGRLQHFTGEPESDRLRRLLNKERERD